MELSLSPLGNALIVIFRSLPLLSKSFLLVSLCVWYLLSAVYTTFTYCEVCGKIGVFIFLKPYIVQFCVKDLISSRRDEKLSLLQDVPPWVISSLGLSYSSSQAHVSILGWHSHSPLLVCKPLRLSHQSSLLTLIPFTLPKGSPQANPLYPPVTVRLKCPSLPFPKLLYSCLETLKDTSSFRDSFLTSPLGRIDPSLILLQHIIHL